jgi:hypothetical protein
MARITTSATVTAGSGLGPTTYIYAIATGTITTAAACQQIAASPYFGTIASVEGIGNGEHIMVQGGAGGAAAISGVTLVATFAG